MASIFKREITLDKLVDEGVVIAQQAWYWRKLIPIYITSGHKVESAVLKFLEGVKQGEKRMELVELGGGIDSSPELISFLKRSPANKYPDLSLYNSLSRSELIGYWKALTLSLFEEKQTREPGTDLSGAKRPVMMIYQADTASAIRGDRIGVEALSSWTYNFLPAVAILGSVEARFELFKRYRQVLGETIKVV